MNAFVCGGAGFIGGHLVRRLLDKGAARVVVFDNLTSGKRDYAPESDPRVRFVFGHAQDYDKLRSAIFEAAPDIVYHLAANPDISRAVTEPTIDFDQGTVLAKNLLEAMRVCGVKRLVYFSGSGVYGEPLNQHECFTEYHGPNEPISTYGASKLACEAMISAYCAMFGLVARAFRFANVVGPRQTHGVGYDFLRRLKTDRVALRILGDGAQTKSYIFVYDVLNAVEMVVTKTMSDDLLGVSRPFDVYNVTTADTLTVTQIAEMAVLASGIPPGYVRFDFTGGDRGWKGDVPRVRLNAGKIHALGWRCQHTSKDAMWLALLAMREEMNRGA